MGSKSKRRKKKNNILIILFCCVAVFVVIFISAKLYLFSKENIKRTENGINEIPNIKVAVFNGCGTPDVARMVVFYLVGLGAGFDVVNGMGENAEHFNFESSFVVDRRGMPEMARRVANALGIQEIILQRTTDPYFIQDISVIVGKDYPTIIPFQK